VLNCFAAGGFMFVDWKDDLRGALGELSEFVYRNAEDLNSKMDRLKGNLKRRLEIIREVREAVSRELNFLALQSDVICRAEKVLPAWAVCTANGEESPVPSQMHCGRVNAPRAI
jgi:hypothetical protein